VAVGESAARRPTSDIVHEHWETYYTEVEDRPLAVSFDVDAAQRELSEVYPRCARLMVEIKGPGSGGGPGDHESSQLHAMENRIVELLAQSRVPCRFLARLTHAGNRELVFAVSEWDRFRTPVGRWLGEFDYQIELDECEDWDYYNDWIRPTPQIWQLIADRRIVDELISAGSDPVKPHHLKFVFIGLLERLTDVEQALRARGYRRVDTESDGSHLVMTASMPLDIDAISTESLLHHQLADEHGLSYDGWGASIVR
jgi:regulator of RNase E activity RraB